MAGAAPKGRPLVYLLQIAADTLKQCFERLRHSITA